MLPSNMRLRLLSCRRRVPFMKESDALALVLRVRVRSRVGTVRFVLDKSSLV